MAEKKSTYMLMFEELYPEDRAIAVKRVLKKYARLYRSETERSEDGIVDKEKYRPEDSVNTETYGVCLSVDEMTNYVNNFKDYSDDEVNEIEEHIIGCRRCDWLWMLAAVKKTGKKLR